MREEIQKLINTGDKIQEELNDILDDPVVNEYLKQKDWLLGSRYKWTENPRLKVLEDWDSLVGDLHRQGLDNRFDFEDTKDPLNLYF